MFYLPILALAVGLISAKPIYALALRRGLTTVDVFKGREDVPRVGGLVAFTGGLTAYSIAVVYDSSTMPILIAALTSGLIGLLDDVRGVRAYYRIGMTLIPMLLVMLFVERLVFTIPGFRGVTTGVVWFLALLAIPIVGNAYNMLDVVNGFLPMSNVIISIGLIAYSIITGRDSTTLILLSIHLAYSIALYVVNRYPARMLNGNVGSYFLGTTIATIAVVYDLVVPLILMSSPYILNGILTVFSTRGFRERERVERPTELNNGLLEQKCGSRTVTLVRILVAGSRMGEYEIYSNLVKLTALAVSISFVALICLEML